MSNQPTERPESDYDKAVKLYYAGSQEWTEFTGQYTHGGEYVDDFEYFLGVVPPARQYGDAVLVGEPYTHDPDDRPVYMAVKREGGKCYGRLMTRDEFDQTFYRRPGQTDAEFLEMMAGVWAAGWGECSLLLLLAGDTYHAPNPAERDARRRAVQKRLAEVSPEEIRKAMRVISTIDGDPPPPMDKLRAIYGDEREEVQADAT
jgi:hypothetical protein